MKTFPLFHGLSDEALANIARVAMMRRFPRGQSVVCAGDRPDYVYLVLTGSLKVVVSDEDGREVILSILGQGELFFDLHATLPKELLYERELLICRLL